MKRTQPYNTALKSYVSPLNSGHVELAATPRGMVFYHDICEPLGNDILYLIRQNVQCIYSEPSWRGGFQSFKERANNYNENSYADYLNGIRALIVTLSIPTFLVCGKKEIKRLRPLFINRIQLNGHGAWLGIWNFKDISGGNTVEFINDLSSIFFSVYDFSCGFGSALHNFMYSVGSDINCTCLSYVSKEILHGNCK